MSDTDRKFGRLVSFDERSRNYPIRALIGIGAKPRSYTWACPVWLDQGSSSACTGFALAHEAVARPVEVKGVTYDVAQAIYRRARQLDEWPGENYEGSSVLGAMKAGMERGWYDEYRWAFGEEDLALAIGWAGPAVIGVNWYEGMLDPCPHCGVLSVSGALLGGHAILCNGYSVTKGFYRVHNSWGRGWGKEGAAYITKEDMARLLKEQGEACIPVKRKTGL